MGDHRAAGNGLVFIAAMAWSTTGLFTRIVTTDIATTLFWRSLTGALSVLLICYLMQPQGKKREAFRVNRTEILVGIIMACSMITLIASFFYTTVANVYFVFGSMPLLTLLLSVLFLKDKVTAPALVACLLCLVGTAVVVSGADKPGDTTGLVLAFVMTALMASMTVATKAFPDSDMAKATYVGGFMVAVVVLPFSSVTDTSGSDLFWLTLYGVSNIGLGFCVYLWGVARTTAISAALVGLTQIPIAPVWTWLLYDERVSMLTISGGIIMLAAAVLYLLTDKNSKVQE